MGKVSKWFLACLFVFILMMSTFFNIVSAKEDPPILPEGAPEIISDFGSWYNTVGDKREKQHEAIDIIEEPGYPVIAAASGKVVRADNDKRWGNRIVIYHGKNSAGYPVRTLYHHNQKNLIKKGDRVKRGQVIAELGQCPDCKTPHLHFAVITGPKGNLTFESPHKYWVDGPNKVTCYSSEMEYKNNLLFTYPVPCKK